MTSTLVLHLKMMLINCDALVPPLKRSARESPGGVTSPLSILAPLSGMAGRVSGSPTPAAASFLSNLPGLSGMSAMSSLRSNISSLLPQEMYGMSGVSGVPNSSSATSLMAKTVAPALSPTAKIGTGSSQIQAASSSTGGGGRSRGSGALHGQSGGRVKQLPTWMDAPDDLFFHSTQVTK